MPLVLPLGIPIAHPAYVLDLQALARVGMA
jgi:hypothetical protein